LRKAIHDRWPGDGQSGLRQAALYACIDRAHGFPREPALFVIEAVGEVAATYGQIRSPKGWFQHERAQVRKVVERKKAEHGRREEAKRRRREQQAREDAERT